MPLGMGVGLAPGDFVLNGNPASQKGDTVPIFFDPCLLWLNGRSSQLLLSCCSNKVESVGLRKCPYLLTKKTVSQEQTFLRTCPHIMAGVDIV